MKHISILLALSCFLLLISCGQKQGKIGIVEKEIGYSSNGTPLKGFLAYDGDLKEPRPGIIVVHEWWGLNSYARKRARMLAELGYTALAIDMYGNGKQASHPEDAQKFAMEVFSNLDVAKARFEAGLKLLKEQPQTDSEKIAAIGYCFGGGVVLHMARFGEDIKGVVSFHGSLPTQFPAKPNTVKAQLLVCNGMDDPFTTEEQIKSFKKEMDDVGVKYTFINYPGAVHSFTNPGADSLGKKFNLPLAYNKKADEESWNEMQKFFHSIFK